jgi:hypothetical protein
MKTKKSFLVKDGLKRVFQTTLSLSLLLAACIFIGCATTPQGPHGTLTITGIPAEFEGKFITASSFYPLTGGSNQAHTERTVITNGEVALSIYKGLFGKNGYIASDTLQVSLDIADTKSAGSLGGNDAIFTSVTFENGDATVNWEDAVRPGYITITGIPADLHGGGASGISITIGYYSANPFSGIPVTVPAGLNGHISNGTVTLKVYQADLSRQGLSYTETGIKDIWATIDDHSKDSGMMAGNTTYLFKAVQITDGKATIDFSRGVRQN